MTDGDQKVFAATVNCYNFDFHCFLLYAAVFFQTGKDSTYRGNMDIVIGHNLGYLYWSIVRDEIYDPKTNLYEKLRRLGEITIETD